MAVKYALTALIAAALCYAGYRFDRRMRHDCTWLCPDEDH